MQRFYSLLLLSEILFPDLGNAQFLPYIPSRVFQSQIDTNLIYVFLSTPASDAAQLLSLNISSTIQAASLPFETLSPSLPFFSTDGDTGDTIAYIPTISQSGSIGVYAGSCTSNSSLWIYQPANPSTANSSNGTWSQSITSVPSSIASTTLAGANFLSSAFFFSSLVNTDDTQRTFYAFGGMCSTNTNSNSTTWQEDAVYSNNMLKLSPSTSTAESYQLSVSAAIGTKPIPEAGFTITSVLPTISNSSTGIVTQARNYVLIGGHTQSAFINMSQVAIFSLPQESWSFQTIDPGATSGNTELAVKSPSTTSQSPDSRSGHTAILSSDGSAIIVFGGWVGDVNTPADPQLAVLNLGSGFGGSGDWSWNIPTTSGTSFQAGEGLYGHDAILLPGEVMMIVGGFVLSSSNTKSKRTSASSTQAYFLNTTSMSWLSSYINPQFDPTSPSSTSSTASSSSAAATDKSKKIGLGAGLGVGFAAIIGAGIVYFWYSRRLKKRRDEAREEHAQSLSQSANNWGEPWWNRSQHGEMLQRDSPMPLGYSPASFNSNNNNFEDGMSPSSFNSAIPRKPVTARNARNYYQNSPSSAGGQSYSSFDFGTGHTRANSLGTAGIIHPIYEDEEELENHNSRQDYQNRRIGESIDHTNHDPPDPFQDPIPSERLNPLGSHPMSRPRSSDPSATLPGSPTHETDHEIREWVSDWAAADAVLNSQSRSQHSGYNGHISPTKDSTSGRTESNISERSIATVNALELSRSSSLNTRTNSLTAFFTGNGATWSQFTSNVQSGTVHGFSDERGLYRGNVSPESDRSGENGGVKGPRPPPSSGSGTSSSFTTAHTSQSNPNGFSSIRAEGESLLSRPNVHHEGSPSKNKPRRGWLGSLKRVFVGEEWVSSDGSDSPNHSPTREYKSPSFSESPTRLSYDLDSGPRRTASASATLWRRKQGRNDWEDSAESGVQQRSNTLTLGSGPYSRDVPSIQTDDEEWDIEKAIERRQVQVMFTIPREKLRVVNQDVEIDDEASEPGGFKEMDRKRGDAKGKAKDTTDSNQFTSTILETPDAASRPFSPGKGKGRVIEMVEKLESPKI